MDGSIWEVSGESRKVPRPLFLVCFFDPFFYPPGSILGWFWEAKTPPKIDFLGVLFCICFFVDFVSFFCRFLECFYNVFEAFLNVFFVMFLFFSVCAFFENVDFISIFTVFRGCWLSLAKMFAH